jgi:hypothetical protein
MERGSILTGLFWMMSRQRLHAAQGSGDSIEPRHMPGSAQDIRVSTDIRR